MRAEDLRGKPQAETEAKTDLELIQAYRQRLLIPVAAIIATTQELGLFGRGWYRILEEKWGKNFSVSGSFIPTESFEFTAKTFRPMTQTDPLKSIYINTAMRRSQERHGLLNLGRVAEVNPEGKIALSLYRDPAKRIIIDSRDKLSINIKVSNDLPEGDKLPFKVNCWFHQDDYLPYLTLNQTSGNFSSEVFYRGSGRPTHPYLLEAEQFDFIADFRRHFSIPTGLAQQDFETIIEDKLTKLTGEIQEPASLLIPQFPVTFDSESFVETTLGELEKELAALNSDLKKHFPTRK